MSTTNRVSLLLIIIALPMIISFYGLSNISEGNETEFKTLTLFFLIYLGFGFGLLFTQVNLAGLKQKSDELELFWTNEIDKNGVIWVIIGVIGVFASVALVLTLGQGLDQNGLRNAQILGILLAGFIMITAFLKTNSLLVPVIIHGVYNSFIVYLQYTKFELVGGLTGFASVPISVPQIGIGFQGFADLYSEIIWQFFLVAIAEEFLKLGVLVFVVILLYGVWKSKSLAVIVGAVIAVIFWSILHQIQALPST